MPAERLPMRKVREVLRLKHACGVSERVIARSLGVSRSTVAEYLRRAAVIGLAWPIPGDLDEAALERRLFTPPGFHAGPTQPQPDWSRVHTELRRRGVTLLPDSGPAGSSVMRRQPWSCRPLPALVFGIPRSNGGVAGCRRPRCIRRARPSPRAGFETACDARVRS